MYVSKKLDLQELETLESMGLIDLFYGDESHVSCEGYVPYGWQFPDEEVAVYVEKGYKTNIFGMINRSNVCHWETTQQNINSEFVIIFLENLSFKIQRKTVVALDNASVHRSKLFITATDNLNGFTQTIRSVFPESQTQICVVRSSDQKRLQICV